MEEKLCGTCEYAHCTLTCTIAEKIRKKLLIEQIFPNALKIKSENIYYNDGKNCPCWQKKVKK